MQKTVFAFVAVLLVVFTVSPARADMIRGDIMSSDIATFVNDGESILTYLTPMSLENLTTGQGFPGFCADFMIETSAAFGSATGQAYDADSLLSPTMTIYSDLQKSQVNDLFSYAYATAFDASGAVIDAVNAQSLQLAIWEILTETTGNLDVLSGSFYGTDLVSAVADTTQSWLDVLNGTSTWDSLGLSATQYDITVYVAEGGTDVSQTLLSITAPEAATPEPSTMAMFALGFAGAFPFLRRRLFRERRTGCDG